MFRSRVCAILAASAIVLGAQSADKEKAIQLVKEAAAFGKANGKDKLFKEVSMMGGKFHVTSEKALYVLIYDLNGICAAHGFKPTQIGVNRFAVKDVDGKAYIQEFIKTAKEKGKGWVDYKYENPATKKLDAKTTYVELWDGYVIGCGIYK